VSPEGALCWIVGILSHQQAVFGKYGEYGFRFYEESMEGYRLPNLGDFARFEDIPPYDDFPNFPFKVGDIVHYKRKKSIVVSPGNIKILGETLIFTVNPRELH